MGIDAPVDHAITKGEVLTLRMPRRHHLTSEAASLDAALTGAGPDVATPPLGRLGNHLRHADLGPRDAFRSELRNQLVMAQAAPAPARRVGVRTSPDRRPASWFATRITAGIAAAGVMVTGVGVASARALPGDALYGVKRDAESVQLDLASGDSARGLLHLQFAASRLAEVHALLTRAGVAAPKPDLPAAPRERVTPALAATLRSTLSAMDTDTSVGASELTQSFFQKRQDASLTKLAAFTTQQENALTLVLPALPAHAAATSLHVLHTVAAQTTALLAEPAAAPATPAAGATAASPSGSPAQVSSSPSAQPVRQSASPSTSPSPSPSVEPSGSSSPSPTPPPKSATSSPSTVPTSPTPSASPSPVNSSPSPVPSASPSESATTPTATASPTVTP